MGSCAGVMIVIMYIASTLCYGQLQFKYVGLGLYQCCFTERECGVQAGLIAKPGEVRKLQCSEGYSVGFVVMNRSRLQKKKSQR